MRTALVAIAVSIVLVLVGLQFVPLEYPPDNPPAKGTIAGPPEVVAVLRRACFDCHSNETRWPWYASVAPISWSVTGDVAAARSRLNFSNWEGLRDGFKRRHAGKVVEEVQEGDMPMPAYLWMHSDARLSEQDIAVLVAWRDALGTS